MQENTYQPVIAICYDFDKTLSPDDIQAQGFIQSLGLDVADFWAQSNQLAEENGMDQNLAWMYQLKKKSAGKKLFTKETFMEYGSKVSLFPGVADWFERINQFGANHNVIVEHYIISSGLKEMIQGHAIAKYFKEIYACSFIYDDDGVAVWPAQVVNYTNKTQFLFRIEKNVLDVNNQAVNDHFAPDQLRVPFRNMIYIGDSDTDVPCMKLVNSYGGHSIGVYNAQTRNKNKVYKMMRDGRIKYFVPADYREGQELEWLVQSIIERTETNERLERWSYDCQNEVTDYDTTKAVESQQKMEYILALEESKSFKETHRVITLLDTVESWTEKDVLRLMDIATTNSQVYSVVTDPDVRKFFDKVTAKFNTERINAFKDMLQHGFVTS